MKEVRICPRCKSINVKKNVKSTLFGTKDKWVCNSCGFESIIFPIKEISTKIKIKK